MPSDATKKLVDVCRSIFFCLSILWLGSCDAPPVFLQIGSSSSLEWLVYAISSSCARQQQRFRCQRLKLRAYSSEGFKCPFAAASSRFMRPSGKIFTSDATSRKIGPPVRLTSVHATVPGFRSSIKKEMAGWNAANFQPRGGALDPRR